MTKKGSEKSLAVPRQRTPAQGARPLGTPKRWSFDEKAKKCRSAAFFLTPLRPLPIDPSGAKIFLVRRGGFYIRPVFFSVALNCTDEQCSPLQRV